MDRRFARTVSRYIAIIFVTVFLIVLLPADIHTGRAAPATDHPRLWIRASDLPRLRSWAVDTNPVYHNGLAALTADAVKAMDSGTVPAQDQGGAGYDQYPTEMYAQLFAFMSLVGGRELVHL